MQTKTCDICGKPAVDTVEMKSSTTTLVTVDVCEECLAEYKRLVREFSEVKLALPVQ